MTEIKVGDRVAYSAAFLRSIGAMTGDMPAGRGGVIAIEQVGGLRIARVKWDCPCDAGDLPDRVNVRNLARVGSAAMSAL